MSSVAVARLALRYYARYECADAAGDDVLWRIRIDSVHGEGDEAQTTELAFADDSKKTLHDDFTKPITDNGSWKKGKNRGVNCPSTCGNNCAQNSNDPFGCLGNGRTDCDEQTSIDVGKWYQYALPADVTPTYLHISHCDSSDRYPKLLTVMSQKTPGGKWVECTQLDTKTADEWQENAQYVLS